MNDKIFINKLVNLNSEFLQYAQEDASFKDFVEWLDDYKL